MEIQELNKEVELYNDILINGNPTNYTKGYNDGLEKAQKLVRLYSLPIIKKMFNWDSFFIGLSIGSVLVFIIAITVIDNVL